MLTGSAYQWWVTRLHLSDGVKLLFCFSKQPLTDFSLSTTRSIRTSAVMEVSNCTATRERSSAATRWRADWRWSASNYYQTFASLCLAAIQTGNSTIRRRSGSQDEIVSSFHRALCITESVTQCPGSSCFRTLVCLLLEKSEIVL